MKKKALKAGLKDFSKRLSEGRGQEISCTLTFTHDEIVNLEVAVRLRVESQEDNGDPDTHKWKPLLKRLQRARGGR